MTCLVYFKDTGRIGDAYKGYRVRDFWNEPADQTTRYSFDLFMSGPVLTCTGSAVSAIDASLGAIIIVNKTKQKNSYTTATKQLHNSYVTARARITIM